MVSAHLKWPCGQDLKPCSPHGRQVNGSVVSTMKLRSDSGPKPKSGTVEQKMAVTGALTAEARCRGAESFTKFMLACCINAADSRKLNSPDRFITPGCFALDGVGILPVRWCPQEIHRIQSGPELINECYPFFLWKLFGKPYRRRSNADIRNRTVSALAVFRDGLLIGLRRVQSRFRRMFVRYLLDQCVVSLYLVDALCKKMFFTSCKKHRQGIFVKPDRYPGPGKSSDQSRTGKPVNVDHIIVTCRTHLPNELQ